MNLSKEEQVRLSSSIPIMTTLQRAGMKQPAPGTAVIVWDSNLSKVLVHNGTAWYILTTTAE